MPLPLAAVLGFALAFLLVTLVTRAQKKKRSLEDAKDSTPALDAWVESALELELAEGALGMRSSTPEERKKLARSLRGDFDPEVVTRIEEAVSAVEIEFVRYAHEKDAEAILRVRYEDGRTGTATKRLDWTDVPASVRTDFERRSASRVFRTWPMPWTRMHAL